MPFDDQRCTVNISSWAYDLDEMNITTDNVGSEMTNNKLDVWTNVVLLTLFEHFPVQRQFWMGRQSDRSHDERCEGYRKRHLCGKMVQRLLEKDTTFFFSSLAFSYYFLERVVPFSNWCPGAFFYEPTKGLCHTGIRCKYRPLDSEG